MKSRHNNPGQSNQSQWLVLQQLSGEETMLETQDSEQVEGDRVDTFEETKVFVRFTSKINVNYNDVWLIRSMDMYNLKYGCFTLSLVIFNDNELFGNQMKKDITCTVLHRQEV